MRKTILSIGLLLLSLVFFNGCLTCEKKEYTFTMTGTNSGKLSIKFINLMSTQNDSLFGEDEDFESLINDYYLGNTFDEDYPRGTVTSKRLFEEDGVLCGEVVIEFYDLGGAGLYRYKDSGPYMYCLPQDMEIYNESNGEFGGDYMPVVFWDSDLDELTLSTILTDPAESTFSLLDKYNEWKINR